MVQFEWDREKSRQNFRKHRITFPQAMEIWKGFLTTEVDNRQDYGEVRFVTLGVMPNTNAVLHVTHVDRGGKIRIISARLATKREREKYYEERNNY
jgi:uncharacterized protein